MRGLTRAQVQKRLPEVYRKRFVQRIPDYKVPQGESLNDRFARVSSFMKDMVLTHPGEEVVVVTHGGVIDDVFRVARSLPPEKMTGLVKPYGSISVIVYDPETDSWEEEECVAVSHLPQVVAEAPTGGQLYLFPHQVAGSFPLLRGDLGELCKPATQNEIDVYDVLSSGEFEISDYIPVYLGKLKINVSDILKNLSVLVKPFERMHEVPCESSSGNTYFDVAAANDSVRVKAEQSRAAKPKEEVKLRKDTETASSRTADSGANKIKRRRHSVTKENLATESKEAAGRTSNLPPGKLPW